MASKPNEVWLDVIHTGTSRIWAVSIWNYSRSTCIRLPLICRVSELARRVAEQPTIKRSTFSYSPPSNAPFRIRGNVKDLPLMHKPRHCDLSFQSVSKGFHTGVTECSERHALESNISRVNHAILLEDAVHEPPRKRNGYRPVAGRPSASKTCTFIHRGIFLC